MTDAAPQHDLETAAPEIVASLDDDTGMNCVDILRHPQGHFTYVEYARDADDEEAWHERADSASKSYPSQYAAYAAALRDIEWLME